MCVNQNAMHARAFVSVCVIAIFQYNYTITNTPCFSLDNFIDYLENFIYFISNFRLLRKLANRWSCLPVSLLRRGFCFLKNREKEGKAEKRERRKNGKGGKSAREREERRKGYSFMLQSRNQTTNQIPRSYKNDAFDWPFDLVIVT